MMWRRFRLRAFESLESRHLLAADLMGSAEVQVADFALVDVNSTSSFADQSVSPRDFMGQISAWYFGYAT